MLYSEMEPSGWTSSQNDSGSAYEISRRQPLLRSSAPIPYQAGIDCSTNSDKRLIWIAGTPFEMRRWKQVLPGKRKLKLSVIETEARIHRLIPAYILRRQSAGITICLIEFKMERQIEERTSFHLMSRAGAFVSLD